MAVSSRLRPPLNLRRLCLPAMAPLLRPAQPSALRSGRWASRCAALLLALMAVGPAAAAGPAAQTLFQPPADSPIEPRFETIGADVIPRDVVATLAQDRAGFLWVATGDGLMRFDGYHFRLQQRESAHAAERNMGWVRALLAARDGRIWIATESDGLAVYDPLTGRITLRGGSDADGDTGQPRAVAPSIHTLAEGRDGTIWAGTMGAGVLAYDPVTRRTTEHRRSERAGSLPDDRVQALLVDRQGTLWVGSWQGLSRRRAGSDRFETLPLATAHALHGKKVQRLFEAADGRIWVGTQGGDLAVIDPVRSAVTLLAKPPAGEGGGITSFAQPKDGPLWVGRETGIALHDPRDGSRLRHLRHNPHKPTSLGASEITTLLVDRSGWIWVGGLGTGLQRHNPGNRSIWVRGVDARPGDPFAEADVRHLLQLDSGAIWAATHTAGVAVMDRELHVHASLPTPPPAQGASAAAPVRAESMAQASDGTVWLGADGVLYQYSPDRRLLRSVAHDAGRTNRLLGGANGALWVAAQDGLYLLEANASVPVRIGLDGARPFAGEVYALAPSANQGLWVGGVAGLHHIAPGGRTLRPVAASEGRGLGHPVVIGLLLDRRGSLWIDTAVAGLHQMTAWDGEVARFDRISARHGLIGRPFGANLLEDGRGRIWTQMGLYDPASDRLHELTRADGVNVGTGWFGSYVQTADGRMLFGGSKGLLVVQPEAFDPSSFAPSLVVSELRINGRHVAEGPAPSQLRLTPDERSFSVEIAALEFSDPRRVRYAYRLDGFDPEWIETGADFRVATYSNLPAGDYVLRARATNRSGDWGTDELRIDVEVVPEWWESIWLRLGLLPLVVVLSFGLVHTRTRLLQRRQQQLEATVRERTVSLETLSRTLQLKSAELEAASLSDPLTGLHNRRYLTEHIERDVAFALRQHEGAARQGATALPAHADLTFFLIDLDHFKQVNDVHGHAAGDAVLVQMRGRLQQVFRACDHLVRWGGEEFLVVAVGSSRGHASELAERVRLAVSQRPFDLGGGETASLSCSIGFACLPLAPEYGTALDWTDVVNVADAALYQVKREGRNGWLGVVRARVASADELRAWAGRPLQEWRESGTLETVGSR